ncbi:Kynureninase [Variovorax sp. SRS16]|uniref:kynureninase n=1 Tax=Variovorax sp. SRS16 TaxID=282217 RepID=UPI001319B12A|nr:kynureninase [Variovorax sp. SRS16]VTU28210.1 Kynureninase [Variovorax sp. SRS16]
MNPSVASPFTREMAQEMDLADPLAGLRDAFAIDDGSALYMDGNSFGRPPACTAALVSQALDTWRKDLIIAWRRWIHLPREIGDAIARSVVQANPGEVIVGDATSVNLYKAAAAALGAQSGRRTLVTSDDNFPTDMYVLQSLAAQRSLELKVLHADPVQGLDPAVLKAGIDSDTALVCLSHVAYRSGALLDMAQVTRVVHEAGALILWDVSHSAGAVEVPLESSGADLAVGCTYKYLNGGPGAPSFVYVRQSQQARLRQPIWGWFGHRDQFAMSDSFDPAEGIESFLVGIPAILSTLAIEPGVALIAEAGINRLQAKGRRLTEMLVALADEWLAPHGFTVASPRDARRRGSHITLRHPGAKDIVRALIADRVVPDFRPPDMLRLAPAPMYTRHVDAWDAMDRVRQCAARLNL